MKRLGVMACWVLIMCLGQAAPPATQEITIAQIQNFFRAVEDRPEGVYNLKQVELLAAQQNISDRMSLDSWSRLVNAAAKSGRKSRIVLQVHPLLRERPYFDAFVHVLGHSSDLFRRAQVFGNMVEHYPEDPRTPKFGLLLLLDAWNDKWPDGIDLHGNSPREVLEIAILGNGKAPGS